MRAYVEISRQKLIKNYEIIKALVDKDIIAVVKDNAYGHGLIEISRILSSVGVKMLAVSTIEEATLIRKNLIFTPLLLLGTCENVSFASNYRITLAITSLDYLKKLVRGNVPLFVHLQVDTGMHRDGILPNEIEIALNLIKNSKLILKGVFTHFASIETYEQQNTIFEEILTKISLKNIVIHSQASATLTIQNSSTNAVRVGLALYGISDLIDNLEPVLSLKTLAINEIKVLPNVNVSYNQETVKKEGYIYTLPLGYGDGLRREFCHEFIVNELIVRQIGITCMDHLMVFSEEQINLNSKFELIGPKQKITQLAKELNTIPYVILAHISPRLKRIVK